MSDCFFFLEYRAPLKAQTETVNTSEKERRVSVRPHSSVIDETQTHAFQAC